MSLMIVFALKGVLIILDVSEKNVRALLIRKEKNIYFRRALEWT